MEAVFDPLKFYDALIAAEIPEKQARAQAEAMRSAFAAYDASRMQELATKADLKDVRHELEITRHELLAEIRASGTRIIKVAIGAIITQTALLIAVIGIAAAILAR